MPLSGLGKAFHYGKHTCAVNVYFLSYVLRHLQQTAGRRDRKTSKLPAVA
jgi:hypothetical protein